MSLRLGKYELLSRIAKGGMAETFRARLEGAAGVTKQVVIKKVLPSLAEDPDFIAAFIHEAQVSASLSHGNIAQVFEFGQVEGDYFLAMEWVDGHSLAQILERAARLQIGFLPPSIAVFIAIEVLKGLHYAHTRTGEDGRPLDIVHRDVSPDNILVSLEGQVKVIDFGLARAALPRKGETAPGLVKGKFLYFSPEQASLQPLDGRSDVFTLGVVLYRMLSGALPFNGQVHVVVQAIQRGQFTPIQQLNPLVPDRLAEVVARAMAKERTERYGAALELQQALTSLLYREDPTFSSETVKDWLRWLFSGAEAGATSPPPVSDSVVARALERPAEPTSSPAAPQTAGAVVSLREESTAEPTSSPAAPRTAGAVVSVREESTAEQTSGSTADHPARAVASLREESTAEQTSSPAALRRAPPVVGLAEEITDPQRELPDLPAGGQDPSPPASAGSPSVRAAIAAPELSAVSSEAEWGGGAPAVAPLGSHSAGPAGEPQVAAAPLQKAAAPMSPGAKLASGGRSPGRTEPRGPRPAEPGSRVAIGVALAGLVLLGGLTIWAFATEPEPVARVVELPPALKQPPVLAPKPAPPDDTFVYPATVGIHAPRHRLRLEGLALPVADFGPGPGPEVAERDPSDEDSPLFVKVSSADPAHDGELRLVLQRPTLLPAASGGRIFDWRPFDPLPPGAARQLAWGKPPTRLSFDDATAVVDSRSGQWITIEGVPPEEKVRLTLRALDPDAWAGRPRPPSVLVVWKRAFGRLLPPPGGDWPDELDRAVLTADRPLVVEHATALAFAFADSLATEEKDSVLVEVFGTGEPASKPDPAAIARAARLHLEKARAQRPGAPLRHRALPQTIERSGPEAATAFDEGLTLFEQGRFALARGKLERCLALAPGDFEAHKLLGAILDRMGEAKKAVRCYREYLRLAPAADPDLPRVQQLIGMHEATPAPGR